MTIPFADVRASYAAIGPEVQAELADIFATGQFVQGRRVARLEEAFAEYTQSRFAVAVASGTDALEVSLRGLRVAPGDIANPDDWAGPYLDKNVPTDPWKRDYQYEYPGRQDPTTPDIWSFGLDQADGTEDDIISWEEG